MRFNWGSTLAYLFVGLGGVGTAFYLAAAFVSSSYSQSEIPPPPPPPPPGQVQEAPPPPPPSMNLDVEPPSDAAADLTSELGVAADAIAERRILEPYFYDVDGRRDPFKRYIPDEVLTDSGIQLGPLLPLQRYELADLKLMGIIWDVTHPKAMFLDPNNKVHILKKDERIGRNNGYIASIREGEVIVVETVSVDGELVNTTRSLRIAE